CVRDVYGGGFDYW
nr:immunoglobulin heavy chain junction region [Macaca mulatta]MOX00155.1 immunoglobulin heavy chain junction region [Macaca mulatta]MOX01050.1 immunoglobulin heavy chain junction region [Macaca mulatta]MOX01112.1 immunoglobulin heavy chain junction region [Macaca mulatta]MOX02065.1 immunoglobulin heavy chain junction region [Macaca mulatta]